MKHTYLVIFACITFLTSQAYGLPEAESNTGVQSTKLVENSQGAQTVSEPSQPEPNPVETERDTTNQSTPIGDMFHQVVDWLYPKQNEEK